MSQTEIADKHDVSQPYVHKLAKEHKLLKDNRKKRVVLSTVDKNYIASHVKEKGVQYMATKFKVSRDTIYKFLRDRNG